MAVNHSSICFKTLAQRVYCQAARGKCNFPEQSNLATGSFQLHISTIAIASNNLGPILKNILYL